MALNPDIIKDLDMAAKGIHDRVAVISQGIIDTFAPYDKCNYLYPVEKIHQMNALDEASRKAMFYHLGVSFLATWGAMSRGVGSMVKKREVNFFNLVNLWDNPLWSADLSPEFVIRHERDIGDLISPVKTSRTKLLHLARPKLFIPMDDPVRRYVLKHLGLKKNDGNNATAYIIYLYLVAVIAREASSALAKKITGWDDKPRELSCLYMIDKYFWFLCNLKEKLSQVKEGGILDIDKTEALEALQGNSSLPQEDMTWIASLCNMEKDKRGQLILGPLEDIRSISAKIQPVKGW